jgi:prepilin-type N-terminal cleavage/methylation domain-containing protein
MKVMNSKIKSFTLIELLVVISIIGLLSSIVLVATKGSRAKAQIAKALEFSQTIHASLGSEAVGVWDFDNCTASDASGYGNNGTINGATCSSDSPYSAAGQGAGGKNSFSFDGVDDYVSMNSAAQMGLGEITLSYWLYFPSGLSVNNRIPVMCGATGGGRGYGTRLSTYIFNSEIYGLLGSRQIKTFDYSAYKDQWAHIAVVFGRTSILAYVNGVQKIADPTIVDPGDVQSTSHVDIGSYRDHNQYFLTGKIDDVRIYSQALTQSQIQQQYAEGLRKYNDLAIYK